MEDPGGGNGGHGCLLALVLGRAWQAGTIKRLLFPSRRSASRTHRHALVDGDLRQPLSLDPPIHRRRLGAQAHYPTP